MKEHLILKKTAAILSFVLLLLLSGCFTGVESTPRISNADVRRETKNDGRVFSEHEEKIASRIVSPPPAQWRRGERFIVCDPKISHTFNSTPGNILPAEGDTIVFVGFENVRNIMGQSATNVKLVSERGDTLTYRIDAPVENILERKSLDIPFTISLRMAERADSILKGTRAYVTTAYRYNSSDGKRIERRRFQPVTISSVKSGNVELPLRVFFKEKGNGADEEFFLWMTPGASRTSTRNFPALFSLSDPREKYPAITDEVWNAITMSRVIPDMTKQECRLALGSPSEVIRGHSYSSVYERWIYQDGINLIFEDGLLKSVR